MSKPKEVDSRAPDQDATLDQSFATGTLPSEDRRATILDAGAHPDEDRRVLSLNEAEAEWLRQAPLELSDPITEPGKLVNPADPSTEMSAESGFKSDIDEPIPATKPMLIPSAPLALPDWRDKLQGFTYDDLDVLASLPVGGSVTRTATGWTVALNASGTQTATGRNFVQAVQFMTSMREVAKDGTVTHVTPSGDVIL